MGRVIGFASHAGPAKKSSLVDVMISDNDIPKHRKRVSKKKPYSLHIGKISTIARWLWDQDYHWRVKRYDSMEKLQQAYDDHMKKGRMGGWEKPDRVMIYEGDDKVMDKVFNEVKHEARR